MDNNIIYTEVNACGIVIPVIETTFKKDYIHVSNNLSKR